MKDKQNKQFRCQFLTETDGSLPKELKALGCEIFPLNTIYSNGQIEFYLSKDCYYYKDIPEEWVEETKKLAIEKFNSWTEEEKIITVV